MTNGTLPTLLVFLAAALCALAIFAPRRDLAVAPVSFAPPLPPLPPVERWSPPAHEEPFGADGFDWNPPPPPLDAPATWPLLVDVRAQHCGADARRAVVDALAALRAPWADAILERALADEPDDDVRAAVRDALESRVSGAVTSR